MCASFGTGTPVRWIGSRRDVLGLSAGAIAASFVAARAIGTASADETETHGISAFGDLNQYGEDSIRFFTRTKVVTQRWPHGGPQ